MNDRDLKRTYWTGTAMLLTAGVAGFTAGIDAAIGLAFLQLAHFAWRDREPLSLTMQVRWLYLVVLFAGFWPPLAALHVLALAGVWANILFDYCLAARLLMLMPWNRSTRLTFETVRRVMLAPPRPGRFMS